jgi:hypothetical protein
MLPSSRSLHFALKMEATWTFETLLSSYIIWHHNPEDLDLLTHSMVQDIL